MKKKKEKKKKKERKEKKRKRDLKAIILKILEGSGAS